MHAGFLCPRRASRRAGQTPLWYALSVYYRVMRSSTQKKEKKERRKEGR